jgi:hypothetical protein
MSAFETRLYLCSECVWCESSVYQLFLRSDALVTRRGQPWLLSVCVGVQSSVPPAAQVHQEVRRDYFTFCSCQNLTTLRYKDQPPTRDGSSRQSNTASDFITFYNLCNLRNFHTSPYWQRRAMCRRGQTNHLFLSHALTATGVDRVKWLLTGPFPVIQS